MEAIIELGKLGPKAAPAAQAIGERLENDSDPQIRKAAAGILEKIGPDAKAAVPSLIVGLKDTGHDVSWWCASALGKIGPAAKDAVPGLITLMKSNSSSEAYTAAIALGRIGPGAKEAVPELLRVVEKNPHHIRAQAAEALWHIEKNKDAIPALNRMVLHTTGNDMGAAAEALGRIGPDAKLAVPALEHALRHQGSLVAVKAALALWQIEKHKDAIPFLIDQLKHRDGTERGHAVYQLGLIGPDAKEAIPALEKAILNDPSYSGSYAREAIQKIDPAAAKKSGTE
jgi:HEAT repeat protein